MDVNVNCLSLKDKINDLVWRATHGHEKSAKIKASNGKFKWSFIKKLIKIITGNDGITINVSD